MTQFTTTLGRTARRLALLALPLVVATTGTAAAHGGSYGGGMMGSGVMGGGGLFGGAMGFGGLFWMGLLVAVPLYLVVALAGGRDDADADADGRPLSVLRERYARGELSEEEFERRCQRLERAD